MINVEAFKQMLVNILHLPTNRDQLEALVHADGETDERKCVELMIKTLQLLKADTTVIYVVGQQTPHGCQLSTGKFYTDWKLAEKEVEYWKHMKCDFMKRFRLDLVSDLPDYMKTK